MQVPDRKREQGGRPRLFEKEDLETGGRQDPGAKLGEFRGMMPRVVGDHARSGRAFSLARSHIVGQSARALGDRPLVEDIGADRIHLAAPAAGAKLEHGVKGIVKLVPSFVLDVFEQRLRYLANGASVSQRRIFADADAEIRPSDPACPSRASASAGVIMVRHFLAPRVPELHSLELQANSIRDDRQGEVRLTVPRSASAITMLCAGRMATGAGVGRRN